MSPETQKPDIERITNRYIDAWEAFGEDVFSVEELENELLRTRDPENVPGTDSIKNDLYRVSILGLVDWFGEGKYRVAIPPQAEDSEWNGLMEDQMEWMHSEIKDRIDERKRAEEEQAEQEDEESLSDSPEKIEYNGSEYMSAFVGSQSELEDQARYYQAALSPKKYDGVVLRAYQDVADSAEELANSITADNKMRDTVCVYRFEIHDKEMVDVGDHLEYRIYLSETELL